MRTLTRSIALLPLLAISSMVHGAVVPPLDVTVSDAGGKLAFKGKTSSNGTFATGNLGAGNYVVQFTTKTPAGVAGNQFAVVVSAGKKKVTAGNVEGEKFAKGGVAMKVDVTAATKVTGQVVGAQTSAASNDPNVKIINGKRHVWVGREIGSQMPGRWVEEGSQDAASAQNTGRMSKDRVQDIQSKGPPTLPGG